MWRRSRHRERKSTTRKQSRAAARPCGSPSCGWTALLDAWPAFADAFGRESLGYDGYHYTYSLKNFREKGAGKASSRERDGAPPRCTVVGVLDFIRASRLLDEHVCPAACAPQ